MTRFLLLPALLAVPDTAWAICAIDGPLCQTYMRYEVIFDGTVTAIDRIDLPAETTGNRQEIVGHRVVTFSVHKSWRGVAESEARLFLWGGFGVVRSEQLQVALGRRYVVFANRGERGYLETTCSPSAPYESSASTLAFLETLERPPTGGRVSGTTFMALNPFEPPVGFAGPPAIETDVVLTGGGQTWTTRSRGGRYSFDALPAGEFAVRVTVPPNLSASPPDGLVRLADLRACASVAFVFRHDTKIAGAIVSASGRAMKNVPVDLVDPDSLARRATRLMTVRTDDSGAYVFLGAPPGRYIAGVNVLDVASTERPYPRVVYRHRLTRADPRRPPPHAVVVWGCHS